MNISSLPFHIEELSTLILEYNLVFRNFGVSETKLRLNKVHLNSVMISGYNFEFTAIAKQLESTFIEVNLKNEKIVIGCIYRHPSMELSEFNSDYLTTSWIFFPQKAKL